LELLGDQTGAIDDNHPQHPDHRLLQRHRPRLRQGLAERGWRVIASARAGRRRAPAGRGADAVRLDLDDPASIADGLDAALERTGGGSTPCSTTAPSASPAPLRT
jgi:hypothetical protein